MALPRYALVSMAAVGLLLGGAARAGLIDVTQPGDPLIRVDGDDDGDGSSGPPPTNEQVERVIDNLGHKYLNFLDLGSGFIVTPQAGPSVVVGLRLYTANDSVERDPASYELAGSNDDPGDPDAMTWTLVSAGALELPLDRNTDKEATMDPGVHYNQLVEFANGTGYTSYRVIFPTLRDAGATNSMQIAEVDLLVPEPATLGLLAAGAVAALVRRRHR